MKHKWIFIVIGVLFTAVFAFGLWNVIQIQSEYSEGEDAYAELEDYVQIPAATSSVPDTSSNQTQSEEPEEPEETDPTVWPVVDFDALRAVNDDIVGWIYLEGTNINYPVVQGDDNSYYLKHLFEGDWNSAGCIFLDSRNAGDFSDRHSVIYGHHMKNKTMFSQLDGYKEQAFYNAHPTILLLTPEQNYKIEVFSGYVANVEDDAWELGFTTAGYADWLTQTQEKSCFESPVEVGTEDRVVTLSTCSYEFDNARFVVVGVLR